MSSGTSQNIKFCAYSGENFVYQILDSARIIATCKQMQKHYNGKLKLLVFLPLYHIFGLAAMYMWFGFFARTFVFLKNLDPETILYTIRRHKVTHIFAVPLLWHKVCDGLWDKLRERGEKMTHKFELGVRIAQKTRSRLFSRIAFKEVRDNLFGDSVCFMITGGGAISPEALKIFNAVGYHLANGYGMSEVGITSVELSKNRKHLTSGTIGKPFAHVEYAINADGELMVRGKSAAHRIWQKGTGWVENTDWYNTHDLAREKKGRYFILGRRDDMIVADNGENINPDWVESRMRVAEAQEWAVVGCREGESVRPVLIVRVPPYCSAQKRARVRQSAQDELTRMKLAGCTKIMLTSSPLLEENEFKFNRRRIADDVMSGKIRAIDETEAALIQEGAELYRRVREAFAATLKKSPDEIGDDKHFFFDLGGTSLDYFSLISSIRDTFDVQFPVSTQGGMATVNEFCKYIQENT